MLFLFPDVSADLLLIEANGADAVSSYPEILSGRTVSRELSMEPNRTLALEKPGDIRHAVLRRNAQADVDVVLSDVALHDLHSLLPA